MAIKSGTKMAVDEKEEFDKKPSIKPLKDYYGLSPEVSAENLRDKHDRI